MMSLNAGRAAAAVVALGTAGVAQAAGNAPAISGTQWLTTFGVLAVIGVVVWVFNRVT